METANLIFDCLSLNLHLFIYIYIYHFFCVGCISSYEVSSSSYGDIIFRWYRETANLRLDRLPLSFFFYIYISLILILMYLMSRNIVFFFLAIQYFIDIMKLPISVLIVSLSLFICIYIITSAFDVSHDMKYRLLLLAI